MITFAADCPCGYASTKQLISHTYTKYGKVQTNQQRVGVGRFLIASTVYLMTMEPTASFWDCGEFISSAYKLEVGHPPGAPSSC